MTPDEAARDRFERKAAKHLGVTLHAVVEARSGNGYKHACVRNHLLEPLNLLWAWYSEGYFWGAKDRSENGE